MQPEKSAKNTEQDRQRQPTMQFNDDDDGEAEKGYPATHLPTHSYSKHNCTSKIVFYYRKTACKMRIYIYIIIHCHLCGYTRVVSLCHFIVCFIIWMRRAATADNVLHSHHVPLTLTTILFANFRPYHVIREYSRKYTNLRCDTLLAILGCT